MKRDAEPNPFQRGAAARRLGKNLAECPYEIWSWEGSDWRDGWKRIDEILATQPAKEGA